MPISTGKRETSRTPSIGIDAVIARLQQNL